MSDFMTATIMLGTALCFAFPVLLLIFGVLLARATQRAEIDPATRRVGLWLIGAGLLGIALYIVGGLTNLVALCWAAVALAVFTAVLGVLFLCSSLGRSFRAVSWVLLIDTLVVVAFLLFALRVAAAAQKIEAYNNSNEAEVRAALARNPNDPAAHSSLAYIDSHRGDHVGEIAEWRQVLRVEPDNIDALLLLGGRLTQAGKVDEARPIFQRLAARHDQFSANAHKWLVRHGGKQ